MNKTTSISQAAKANNQSATTKVADKSSSFPTSTSQPSLILDRQEVIAASPKVWVVQKADDIIHGINLKLSSMIKSFPFEVAGHTWEDSERLYLLGEFSTDSAEHIAIQKDLNLLRSKKIHIFGKLIAF